MSVDDYIKIIQSLGLPGALLLFAVWFVTFRFWPWFTGTYWPTVQEQKRDLTSMLGSQTNALIEFKASLNQTLKFVETNTEGVSRVDDSIVELRYYLMQSMADLRAERSEGILFAGPQPRKKPTKKAQGGYPPIKPPKASPTPPTTSRDRASKRDKSDDNPTI